MKIARQKRRADGSLAKSLLDSDSVVTMPSKWLMELKKEFCCVVDWSIIIWQCNWFWIQKLIALNCLITEHKILYFFVKSRKFLLSLYDFKMLVTSPQIWLGSFFINTTVNITTCAKASGSMGIVSSLAVRGFGPPCSPSLKEKVTKISHFWQICGLLPLGYAFCLLDEPQNFLVPWLAKAIHLHAQIM